MSRKEGKKGRVASAPGVSGVAVAGHLRDEVEVE